MMDRFLDSIPSHIIDQLKKLQFTLDSTPVEIGQLLNQTVLLGGKRLRPLLLFLMGDLFSLSINRLIPLAQAIEKVHGASLAHDDVVDHETQRRGMPSINVVGGNKRAVLAGDYLLAEVIVQLVQQREMMLVREMAQVIQQLAQGEWLQLESSEKGIYSEQLLMDIAQKKTGSVMSWCCLAPALLAGCSDAVVEYCRQFGFSLGIAFQFMDDILDFDPIEKPDLISSVAYQLAQDNGFGDSEKIEAARERVRQQVNFQLEQARNLLQVICDEQSDKIQQSALKPLDLMLSYLASRGE